MYLHFLLKRGGGGLSTMEIATLIERNGGENIIALIQRGVTESQLPGLLRRGSLIAHVDGNHYDLSGSGNRRTRRLDLGADL